MSTSFVSAIIMGLIIRWWRKCWSSSSFLVRMFGHYILLLREYEAADLEEEELEDDLRLLLFLDLCFLLDGSLLETLPESEVCEICLLLSACAITTLGLDILLKSGSRGNRTLFWVRSWVLNFMSVWVFRTQVWSICCEFQANGMSITNWWLIYRLMTGDQLAVDRWILTSSWSHFF